MRNFISCFFLAALGASVWAAGAEDARHMVSAVDFLPTLLDIVGAAHPAGLDGRSFAPLLRGQTQEDREMVVKEYNENAGGSRDPMRAVQTKQFLYIFNPWSNGERVARNASDVVREIPFVDTAYKNGNSMLFDAGAELRVSASIFNTAGWDSFFRVVYGFNEIHGYGDVNGDDVQDSTDNSIGDELSNETEQPGLRFYVGLGTGW